MWRGREEWEAGGRGRRPGEEAGGGGQRRRKFISLRPGLPIPGRVLQFMKNREGKAWDSGD